jgi:hypothetical protein
MAKVDFTAAPAAGTAAVIVELTLALAPHEAEAAADDGWSIEREPMGPGWHDSSWMLRNGLEVSECVEPEAIPPEWQWRWWLASGFA